MPLSIEDVAGYLVNRVAEQLRDALQEHLRDDRIQPRQAGLLMVLREVGPMQQQLLGERLGMDRTTTMHFVTALAGLGIVERLRDPLDGRAYQIHLTAAGRKLADSVARDIARAEASVLGGLTESEQRTFRRLLRKILANTQGEQVS